MIRSVVNQLLRCLFVLLSAVALANIKIALEILNFYDYEIMNNELHCNQGHLASVLMLYRVFSFLTNSVFEIK